MLACGKCLGDATPEDLRQEAAQHRKQAEGNIWKATFEERVAALGQEGMKIRDYVTEQQIVDVINAV
jgi:hypothetical protein